MLLLNTSVATFENAAFCFRTAREGCSALWGIQSLSVSDSVSQFLCNLSAYVSLYCKTNFVFRFGTQSGCTSILKLYCRYLYTRPCMINHIWGLKQLWLQVNGHAWFHLQRLRWPVRNGEGAKNSKWKYMSPAGFEPTPRQSTTGKLQRLRPLGHAG